MKIHLINEPTKNTKDQIVELLRKNHFSVIGETFEDLLGKLPVQSSINNIYNLYNLPNPVDAEQVSKIYFSSSGSSGIPKLISLRFQDVINNAKTHGNGYIAAGIISSDKVATWGLSGFMNSEFTVYLGLSHTGSTIFPIGDFGTWENMYDLLEKIQPSVLLVMPSDLIPLVNHMENNRRTIESVRLVVFGGEFLSEVEENRLKSTFPSLKSIRGVYQSSEAGTMGYQCTSCKRGQFHLHQDKYVFEIMGINSQTEGSLIVTNLNRTSGDVLRYNTGDIVRKIVLECDSQMQNGIVIVGRESDYIKFGGEKFDSSWFKNWASSLGFSKEDFIVELVKSVNGKDLIRVYSSRLVSDKKLRDQFVDSFNNISKKLNQLLRSEIVESIEILPVHEKVPNRTISGKIKIFSDMRIVRG